jgi:HlyD family secretion protein
VIVILILALAVGLYYGITALKSTGDGQLTASGAIEATIVNVAPEMSGKVTEVLAVEGQSVSTNDPLLRLDPSLLTAQRAVSAAAVDSAKAALATAQTNYDLVVQNALTAQSASTAKDWRFSAPDDFNQPAWYFNTSEELGAAQTEVESAQTALEAAQADLSKVVTDLNNADFLSAEKRLADARAAYIVADTVKTNADNASTESGSLRTAADASYNAALDELRAAQNAYNDLLSTQAADDVQAARGAVAVAQQRYDAAYARQLSLQTGLNSPAVVTAGKTLDQAKTALAQAEASLALLDAQIAKLSIFAPMNGVILTRNVEPGEFVQPGAATFAMADLTNLTLTVYVPEDRYGEISLNQQVTFTVDSFPGMTFTATVVNIASQAEYTPRNVQTAEGRSGTMYAIKLKVNDPEGKLKPGMPADVVFQ